MPETVREIAVIRLGKIERAGNRLRLSFEDDEAVTLVRLVICPENVPSMIEGIRHFTGYELYRYGRA